jgi:hypothetical protein
MAVRVTGSKSLSTKGKGFLLTGISSPVFQIEGFLKAVIEDGNM